MLNRWAFPFRRACKDLTEAEHAAIADVVERYCPKGYKGFDNYVYRMYWLARSIKAARIVELGVAHGVSTLALLMAAQRQDGRVWSCDVSDISPEQLVGYPVDLQRREQITASAAELGRSWQHGPVDLVYLDTSHRYADTVEEIAAWWPHVREGGLFVFHDVESCRPEVFRAVSEAIVKQGRSVEYHHFPDCYGHGVLQWFENWRFNFFPDEAPDGVVGLSTLLAEALIP